MFSSKKLAQAAFLLAWVCVVLGPWSGAVQAGASSATWVVVVNGKSTDSRTLANHFCHLRNLPSRNVIVLDEIPQGNNIDIDAFRDKILGPVLREIDARGIAAHLQGIAYSCDIPTTVQIKSDLQSMPDLPIYITPAASINSLTYLFRWTMAKDVTYVSMDSNWYAAHEAKDLLRVFSGDEATQREIAAGLEKGEHAKVAERYEALRALVGNPFPLDYLAAKQWALAGNRERALERLGDAIQRGWRYRKELANEPAFESLREDKGFQRLVARCPNDPFDYTGSRGFDARNFYAPNTLESRDPKHGIPYLMSVVLGYIRNDRMTMDDAIAMLERSAAADFTRPSGAFLFGKNPDVRSTTRQPNFAVAIERIRQLKMDAREYEGVLPPTSERCAGVMLGISDFDWPKSGATLVPGAIADNLTSMGGMLSVAGQTKLTELLRHGACLSSGAVIEPYAIQNKFPHPLTYSHYANGLTSAESFYGSILSPYQMLIVGDPLCQPFATPPRFRVEGLKPSEHITAEKTLRFVTSEDEFTVDPIRLLWLIDGKTRADAAYTPTIPMRLDQNEKGAHEWRIIAKGPKPLEHYYEQSGWITVGERATHLRLKGPATWSIQDGAGLRIKVENFPPGRKIAIRHEWEIISRQDSERTLFVVDPDKLGYGPVRLQAVVLDEKGDVEYGSEPITVVLKRP